MKTKNDVNKKCITFINLNYGHMKVNFIIDKRISSFGREKSKISETMKDIEKNGKANEQDSALQKHLGLIG